MELIEQKDALKRDLDDTTTKLQKMTEDYNELSQTSKQEYAELQETCDEENNKCNGTNIHVFHYNDVIVM